MALSRGTQRNSIESHYAECHNFFVILGVVMMNVVMLSVGAPTTEKRIELSMSNISGATEIYFFFGEGGCSF
jgi:hypothetical protein